MLSIIAKHVNHYFQHSTVWYFYRLSPMGMLPFESLDVEHGAFLADAHIALGCIFHTTQTGTQAASQCHVCRTVCRRAERRILALAANTEVDENVIAYVNRLSDYLFVLARKLNVDAGQDEIIWKRTCK